MKRNAPTLKMHATTQLPLCRHTPWLAVGGSVAQAAAAHHLVEAKHRTSLQHTAQDRLLTHQIRLDLSHKGRLENACKHHQSR